MERLRQVLRVSPLYVSRHHGGRWRWRVRVYYVDGTSAMNEAGGYKTKLEAAQFGERVRAAIRDGLLDEAEQDVRRRQGIDTLGQLVAAYQAEGNAANRASSRKRDGLALRHLLETIPAETPVDEVTPRQLARFVSEMASRCAAATAQRDLATVRAMFRLAAEDWRILKEDPARRVKGPRIDRGEVVFLEPDEVARLIEACREVSQAQATNFSRSAAHLLTLVVVAVNTGLRKGELFALKWRHVDLRNRTLTVANQTDHATKTGRELVVGLNSAAVEALETWRTWWAQALADARERVAAEHDPESQRAQKALGVIREMEPRMPAPDRHVFPSTKGLGPSGETIAISTVATALGRAWRLAEIPKQKRHLHALRHTFAVALARANRPLAEISRQLGHQSLATTQIYLRFAPHEGLRASDSIGFRPAENVEPVAGPAEEREAGTG